MYIRPTEPRFCSYQTKKMYTDLFLLIPLTLTLFIITKHFIHKFQNLPPTPILNLPFLGHLHLLKKPLHRSLSKLSERYGPVLFLNFGSRQVLVVSSSSAAEECFTNNDIVFANRPRLLAGKYIGYDYTTLAWSSYGDHWRNLRKIASIEVLSTYRLQVLHGIRLDEVKCMARRIYQNLKEGGEIEMKTVFFEFTMNVMMRMIAGKRFYGEGVGDSEESKGFREIVKDTFLLGGSSLADFLPLARWFGGMEKLLVELHKRRDEFMQKLVVECKTRIKSSNEQNRAKTMIDMLLELQEKEPEYYTDQLIRSLMLTLLAAGTDTSAGTMEWALTLMLNNPQVLKKAQLEIDNHIGYDRLLDESDISELPYLRCIINETLRMCPAGPLLVPHESTKQCSVGGYRVPSGTMLLVNVWVIHNDPKNWEDPTIFKPERFEGDEEARNSFKLLPFGTGRRGCPGEGLAIRMMGLGLGTFIQCFDWKRVGEELIDMSEGPGLTMPKAKPLLAYCKPRLSTKKLLSQI